MCVAWKRVCGAAISLALASGVFLVMWGTDAKAQLFSMPAGCINEEYDSVGAFLGALFGYYRVTGPNGHYYRCPPPPPRAFNPPPAATVSTGATSSFAIGVDGGAAWLGGNGTLDGIDTGAGGTLDRRSIDLKQTKFVTGVHVDFFAPPMANGAQLFFRTGYLWYIGSEATASFSGVNTIPQGTGTVTYEATGYYPLLAGLRLPSAIVPLPFADPRLSYDVLGGVYLTMRHVSISGSETGPFPFSGSESYMSADPVVGVAANWALGDPWGLGQTSFGAKVMTAFPQDHAVRVQSNNFATESYTVRPPTSTETLLLFGFTVKPKFNF